MFFCWKSSCMNIICEDSFLGCCCWSCCWTSFLCYCFSCCFCCCCCYLWCNYCAVNVVVQAEAVAEAAPTLLQWSSVVASQKSVFIINHWRDIIYINHKNFLAIPIFKKCRYDEFAKSFHIDSTLKAPRLWHCLRTVATGQRSRVFFFELLHPPLPDSCTSPVSNSCTRPLSRVTFLIACFLKPEQEV